MEARAQSSTTGVILLTAVVVVTVGVGGALVLDSVATDASPQGGELLIDATVELTAADLTVTHAGGDSVALADLSIVARSDGTTERYDVDVANVTGDGDAVFEPSERFQRAHGLDGPTAEVLVIHTASATVLASESLDVGTPGGGAPSNTAPDAQFTVSNAAPTTGASVTFDAGASSDPDGDALTYRWDFGDGTDASGETVQHTYATADTYTAELTVEDTSGATDTATSGVVVSAAEIRVDSTALSDATDGDGTVGPGQSVTVTATVSASGTTVDTVTADASAFDAGTQSLSDGNGDGTYEATFDVGASPAEGPQQVNVTATDTVGRSDLATSGALMVDTTPPAVDRFEVTDESTFFIIFATSSYRIEWALSDESPVSTTVYVNRTGASDNPQEVYGPSGPVIYSRGPFDYEGYNQVHEIKLVATDAAGNQRCVVVTDTADGAPNTPLSYSACG